MTDVPESLTEASSDKSIKSNPLAAGPECSALIASVGPGTKRGRSAASPANAATSAFSAFGRLRRPRRAAPPSWPWDTGPKKYGFWVASLVILALMTAGHLRRAGQLARGLLISQDILTKDRLAKMLADSASFYHFPTEIEIPGVKGKSVLQYSFDPKLQDDMENLFRQYRPDYGAFVAMDAETGQVLSIVSYSTHPDVKDNLALRSTFPSASIFKVVTAAAAIESQKLSPDTVITFNGANHTLYRSNVLRTKQTRWTRRITLREAFARSVNTVFGRIGAYTVGADELKVYADRFGFNHPIEADFPLQQGRAPIPYDTWGLAETASGFTRDNQMSPIQGALIAAAIVNNGTMMEPYFVRSVYSHDGTEIYKAQPKVAELSVDPSTATEIRRLMKETVTRGTSRKSFRGFFRSRYRDLDVGGKTGSLTGLDPKGRYDWFIGFADGRGCKLAFAALTIHEKLWRVKSSYMVRRAIESYFSEQGELAESVRH